MFIKSDFKWSTAQFRVPQDKFTVSLVRDLNKFGKRWSESVVLNVGNPQCISLRIIKDGSLHCLKCWNFFCSEEIELFLCPSHSDLLHDSTLNSSFRLYPFENTSKTTIQNGEIFFLTKGSSCNDFMFNLNFLINL